MAWGVSDPYCRFISPSELSAMKKYDVTGVGLNLGTAAEYSAKTVRGRERGDVRVLCGLFFSYSAKERGARADAFCGRRGRKATGWCKVAWRSGSTDRG